MHKNALFLLKNCLNSPALCFQTPSPRRLGDSPPRPPMAFRPRQPSIVKNLGYATGANDIDKYDNETKQRFLNKRI